MNDMQKVTEPKSDQWNFDDFRSGPMTFTIESVRLRVGQEQPVEIALVGTPKFYRPCKSMSRCLVAAWGNDSKQYAGRSLTLYGDPTIKWGGLEVGGIRISHMSDITDKITMALTATKQSRKPYTVRPLEAAGKKQPAAAQVPETARTGELASASAATPASAADPIATITPDEAMQLEARCTENNIKTANVKKFFKVERFSQLTPAQLAVAHQNIDTTLATRADSQ